jgi:large subunit ribosomal protein L17
MRHGKKINHLGRKAGHRAALLSNMASSLILNKRITTTVAKAKALRKYVEPLLTKAKDDTTHSRRTVFSYLQNKESVKTLFGEVAGKIADRPGGYTRIIKLGDARVGDNAEMCLIELVDFNTLYTKDGAAKKAKTRRSRRGGKKAEGAEGVDTTVAETTAEPKAKKAKAEKAEKVEKTEKKPAKKASKKDKE